MEHVGMIVEQPHTVDEWVDFLGKEHMPALAETIQKLNKLTTDDDSRVPQLTEQILKDPSLTSRVLQISNSVIYKGFGGQIKTITRAIVMLGFTTIRDVSLSMQILDNILKHNPSEYLMNQIANSFHAAVQARGLFRDAKSAAQEEIFISTLLLHFAEMSLLSRDDEISRRLNYGLSKENKALEQVAQEVLGCKFNDIAVSLAKRWELGDVLQEALSKPRVLSKPAQAVQLGDELSQVAPLGWNSEEVKAVIKKIAKYRNLKYKDALAETQEMAELARDIAVQYGAAKVKHLIPSANKKAPVGLELGDVAAEPEITLTTHYDTNVNRDNIEQASSNNSDSSSLDSEEGLADMIEQALAGNSDNSQVSVPHQVANEATPLDSETGRVESSKPATPAQRPAARTGGGSDMRLQMNIMQRLHEFTVEESVNVNGMLSLVLEGMVEALGLERIVMGVTTKDRKRFVPRFYRGEVQEEFKEKLKISLTEENTFSVAIAQSKQFWIGSKLMAGRDYLHTKQLQQVLGVDQYFVAPIVVSRRPIGVFYGDQYHSQRPLTEEQYAGFTMLAQQAGMALTAAQK